MIEQLNQLEKHAKSQGKSLAEWICAAREVLRERGPGRWAVELEKANDGSGDVILNIPNDLMKRAGLNIGDELGISRKGDVISLHLPPR